MNLQPMDLGVCGVEQCMYIGTAKFDSDGVASGISLAKLPKNIIITKAVAVVKTAFNAGTTNVLTVGTNDNVDNILGASDITEGTPGSYPKNTFLECDSEVTVKAKFAQTGTEATAGEAKIYLNIVRTPEK